MLKKAGCGHQLSSEHCTQQWLYDWQSVRYSVVWSTEASRTGGGGEVNMQAMEGQVWKSDSVVNLVRRAVRSPVSNLGSLTFSKTSTARNLIGTDGWPARHIFWLPPQWRSVGGWDTGREIIIKHDGEEDRNTTSELKDLSLGTFYNNLFSQAAEIAQGNKKATPTKTNRKRFPSWGREQASVAGLS